VTDKKEPLKFRMVTVTPSLRPSMWANVAANIVRQIRKPDLSILVRHKTKVEPSLWKEELAAAGIPTIVLDAKDWFRLGDVLGMGFAEAARNMDIGLICTIDDDDYYGNCYLAELDDFFREHQDAAIIGKQIYRCRWLDNSHAPRLMCPRWTPNPEQCASVAGPTISVNVKLWRENPNFRHPIHDPVADVGIIMAAHACNLKVYTTTPDHFWLQRYGPEHGHGWVWDGE